MRKNIYVIDLCSELEQSLIKQQICTDSLKRYQKVFTEFSTFACTDYYSQSLGTDFLLNRLRERGGLVLSDEESRNEEYYFRCMRMLAEYFNFGITLKKADVYGEIIWQAGFRECTEKFYSELVDDGLSYGYVVNSRKVIKDLILFLDANAIHEPAGICAIHNDRFI